MIRLLVLLFVSFVISSQLRMVKLENLCPFVTYSSENNQTNIEYIECGLNEICCQEELIQIENNNTIINVPMTACCSMKNILLENLLSNNNISMADLSLNISTANLNNNNNSQQDYLIFNASLITSLVIGIVLFITILITTILAIKYYKIKRDRRERNLMSSDYYIHNDKIATISSGGYFNRQAAPSNFIQYGGQQAQSNPYYKSYFNSNYTNWKSPHHPSSWNPQFYYMNQYYNYYQNNMANSYYNNNMNSYTSTNAANNNKKLPSNQQHNLFKYLRYLNRKTFQTYLEYNQILEYLNK